MFVRLGMSLGIRFRSLEANRYVGIFVGIAANTNIRIFGLGHIATAVVSSYLDYRFADLNWRTDAPSLALWHQTTEARNSMQATRIVA